MFTCIEILPENSGFFTKLYEKIKPPEPQRQYVQMRGATPFLRLSVRENNVDWCKISSSLVKDERVILKNESLTFPDNLPLVTYVPRKLGMIIMFRTLCRVLEKVNFQKEISISIFDKEGFLIDETEKIVPLVRSASVYTERIGEYFLCASHITRESGMSIKINEYESKQSPAKIIIADEYLSSMKMADFVFLADNSVLSFNTVTGNGIFLEDEYKILKSQSIDDFAFASALFERNNARFFAKRDFLSLSLSKKTITSDELSDKIRQSVTNKEILDI